MEQVMTNGKGRPDHEKRGLERIDPWWEGLGLVDGLETGDPRQFKSFEEVREAFQKQLAWARGNSQAFGNKMEQDVIDFVPTVCESALIDDCVEKGICREEGGARYNFNTGSNGCGSTDVADSLTAIKKLVFDDRRITMAELCDALDNNFEGRDDIRKMCLEAPKFGNDDDYADEQAAWVLHQWVSECTKLKNLRGGYGCAGGSPMSAYVPRGREVGALPSGRLAAEPLCDGHSPGRGQDLNGPTAVLRSMGKVDNAEIAAGIILNMRLDPAVVQHEDGVRRLADMMRAFVDEKIFHVQFNMVSSDTLRDAQKEPEKHRDLVVRVAGYNAFFTRLQRELQDTIIARTVHGL
jgi:formate C-acetyltransferase